MAILQHQDRPRLRQPCRDLGARLSEQCGGHQANFIDYDAERHEKLKRLDEALDKINREYGSETIVLGSQQYVRKEDMGAGKKVEAGVFKDSIKHDFRSPCYTTRWSDIPEAE
jgi:DNA polymerase V